MGESGRCGGIQVDQSARTAVVELHLGEGERRREKAGEGLGERMREKAGEGGSPGR